MSPRDEDVDVVEDMMLSRDIRASLLRKALKIRLHYFHTITLREALEKCFFRNNSVHIGIKM